MAGIEASVRHSTSMEKEMMRHAAPVISVPPVAGKDTPTVGCCPPSVEALLPTEMRKSSKDVDYPMADESAESKVQQCDVRGCESPDQTRCTSYHCEHQSTSSSQTLNHSSENPVDIDVTASTVIAKLPPDLTSVAQHRRPDVVFLDADVMAGTTTSNGHPTGGCVDHAQLRAYEASTGNLAIVSPLENNTESISMSADCPSLADVSPPSSIGSADAHDSDGDPGTLVVRRSKKRGMSSQEDRIVFDHRCKMKRLSALSPISSIRRKPTRNRTYLNTVCGTLQREKSSFVWCITLSMLRSFMLSCIERGNGDKVLSQLVKNKLDITNNGTIIKRTQQFSFNKYSRAIAETEIEKFSNQFYDLILLKDEKDYLDECMNSVRRVLTGKSNLASHGGVVEILGFLQQRLDSLPDAVLLLSLNPCWCGKTDIIVEQRTLSRVS